MKSEIKRILVMLLIVGSIIGVANARSRYRSAPSEYGRSHLLGVVGGVSITSNPPALQTYANKASFLDGNGGLTYLNHNQVNNWYAFEWQMSLVWSSVNTLMESEDAGCKFIFPVDFRWFLGSPVISAYCGIGLQYNTVWEFSEGEGHTHSYYDPWWGYYEEEVPGEVNWDWTINQLSTNLAFGLKLGFGNTDTDFKRHAFIIGTKFHFPIINASEKHGNDSKSVDLSRDRTNVSLTGALSLDVGKGWTFKFDYELPCGGNNTYILNDGGHTTFLNSRSQSISMTILKRIG